MDTEAYESFPLSVVALSTGVALAIYALGAYLLVKLWPPLVAVYLVYCLWLEESILRSSCVHCYYYGKVCGLGKGKLCSLIFPRGDPARFATREVSWRQVLPDMMVLISPMTAGIVLLVRRFDWLALSAMVILTALSLVGNAVVRGSFACKHCKQRELGCPAQRLFAQDGTPST